MFGDWRDAVIRWEERERRMVPFALAMGGVLLGLGALATWQVRRDERLREAAVVERAEAAAALEGLIDQAWRGLPRPGLAALRARVDQERPLGGAETKLIALEGLVAVGRGELAHAQERAAALDARRAAMTPHARALRGAIAAAAGDPHEAVDELSRAIDAGLAHPDLRGWRGVARVAEGLPVPTLAREALGDLDAAAAERPLRAEEAAARARALLALEGPERG